MYPISDRLLEMRVPDNITVVVIKKKVVKRLGWNFDSVQCRLIRAFSEV